MRALYRRQLLVGYVKWRNNWITVNRSHCLHIDKCATLRLCLKHGDLVRGKSSTGNKTTYTTVKIPNTEPSSEKYQVAPKCPECRNSYTSLSVDHHKLSCSYRMTPIGNYETNYKRLQKDEIPVPISQRRRAAIWREAYLKRQEERRAKFGS